MEFSSTIAAWWGAVVATLVLGWEVFKWSRSGARIRPLIALNVNYPDGEVISKEELPGGGTVEHRQSYCHIELSNIGELPTTLLNVHLWASLSSGGQIGTSSRGFTAFDRKQLPYHLHPGEVWSCRIEMDRFRNMLETDGPWFEFRFSHLKEPLKVRLSKEQLDDLVEQYRNEAV